MDSNVVAFSTRHVELFVGASLDRNPLHLSEAHARNSPFGEPVVFGVLGAIAALSRNGPQPGRRLARLELRFPYPIFKQVALRTDGLSLSDGSLPLVQGTGDYVAGQAGPLQISGPAQAGRERPADLQLSDLAIGRRFSGAYLPSSREIEELLLDFPLDGRGLDAGHLIALLWSSYIVGMEVPGTRAMFAALRCEFNEDVSGVGTKPVAYELRIQHFDDRFNSLKAEFKLSHGDKVFASGDIRSFYREDVPGLRMPTEPDESLKARTAWVTGASRGLGAAITLSLLRRGCTVYANFVRSGDKIDRFRQQFANLPGTLIPSQGDVTDSAYAERALAAIMSERGRLDFLFCNACPPLLQLWMDPSAVVRIGDYVSRSLAMTSIPVAVSLPELTKSSGTCVLISSSAVSKGVKEWPHYVSAKLAQEGLLQIAALEYPNVTFVAARPPRLITDLTNTPLGRTAAVDPQPVAETIVSRALDRRCNSAGVLNVLEGFHSLDTFESA
jgi:NAD(P)-dependent dehydrogenase (short-subunit alcohol dehydrogenase family)